MEHNVIKIDRRLMVLCIFIISLVAVPASSENQFKLKPGAEAKLCVDCHESIQAMLNKSFVHTPVKTGECSVCHNPHTSYHGKLLNDDINQLCNNCHKDLIPENARSIHEVVVKGNCLSCHDPHASGNDAILVKKGNDLCFECHGDLGDFIDKAQYKHDPVKKKKGCLNCHDPHASAGSDFILKNNEPALCIECHKTGGNVFAKKHMNYPVEASRCSSCHNAHGSNKKGIVFDGVHKPVAQKKCDNCHNDASSSSPLAMKKDGVELCRECHNDSIDEMLGRKQVHWPLLDKKGCLNCHSPHASKNKNLIAGSVGNMCGACHVDTVELQEISISNPDNKNLCEPVRKGDCISCHTPHSADNALLIAEDSISFGMCDKCHEWQTHSTHPIGEEVIDQRNKNLIVDCLSCHRACGTGNKRAMMPFETTYALCIQCHEGYRK